MSCCKHFDLIYFNKLKNKNLFSKHSTAGNLWRRLTKEDGPIFRLSSVLPSNRSICPQPDCLALDHLGCFEIFMTLRFVLVGIFLLCWLLGANMASGCTLS